MEARVSGDGGAPSTLPASASASSAAIARAGAAALSTGTAKESSLAGSCHGIAQAPVLKEGRTAPVKG